MPTPENTAQWEKRWNVLRECFRELREKLNPNSFGYHAASVRRYNDVCKLKPILQQWLVRGEINQEGYEKLISEFNL